MFFIIYFIISIVTVFYLMDEGGEEEIPLSVVNGPHKGFQRKLFAVLSVYFRAGSFRSIDEMIGEEYHHFEYGVFLVRA